MTAGSRPRLSVVVPSYGRPQELARCLLAIAAQGTAVAEVVVVARKEDSETQATARAVTPASLELVVALVRTPGHLPPLREGIAAAHGAVVAFLDDDCEPWAGWAESLARHYSNPEIGGVGGLIAQPGISDRLTGARVGQFGVVPRLGRTASAHIPVDWGTRDVDVIAGGNMSYRRDLLLDYEWDARINCGAATDYEVHLAAYIRRHGYRVLYDPDAIVTHHVAPRVDIGRDRSPAEIFDYSHNLVYVAGRSFRPLRAALAIADSFLVGNRFSYGLATATYDLASGRQGSIRNQIAASLAGKLAGLASLVAYARRGAAPLP